MEMEKEQAMLSAEKKRTKKILMVLVPATIIMIVLAIVAGIYANKLENDRRVETSQGIIIKATEDTFTSAASKSGYGDIYNEKSNMPKEIKSAIIAVNNDDVVRFLEFKKEDDARSYFAKNAREGKETAKKAGVTDAKQHKEDNYEYYISTVEGKYMYIVRLKNTVVYATAAEANKNNINKLIEILNY